MFKKTQAFNHILKSRKMLNEFSFFVGIDISKKTFDGCILANGQTAQHAVFSQTPKGFTAFVKWLEASCESKTETLLCMEHTGLYTQGLIGFLIKEKWNVWVEMAVKIKRSSGLQRGTNDKASALVIAEYASRFSDRAQLWKPTDTALSALRSKIVQRDRILNALKQLQVPVHELKACCQEKLALEMEKLQQPAIKGLEKSLEKIDASILEAVQADATALEKITLVTSIKGIGFQTAATLYANTKG